MTFRKPFNTPKILANAVVRSITGRVARGYWPTVWSEQGGTGVHRGLWLVMVQITNKGEKRPSDRDTYRFEFPCDCAETAAETVSILHNKFYGSQEEN